jgi:hypothetical protein
MKTLTLTILPSNCQKRQQRVPCKPLTLRGAHIGDNSRLGSIQRSALGVNSRFAAWLGALAGPLMLVVQALPIGIASGTAQSRMNWRVFTSSVKMPTVFGGSATANKAGNPGACRVAKGANRPVHGKGLES